MVRRTVSVIAAALLGASLCGCGLWQGLVGVRIEVQGGGRTLEEQVLGAFEQTGEEVYLLAGVRSIDPASGEPAPPPPMTESKAEAVRARRRMAFNLDDVLAFKRDGLAGEGRDALLVVFEGALAGLDPRHCRLVEEVCAEENADRRVLMERIVQTTADLSGEDGPRAVRAILSSYNRQHGEPGTRVQLPDGSWATAGEGAR